MDSALCEYLKARYKALGESLTLARSEPLVMHNPVYQQQHFYPYRTQMIWQDKEAGVKQKQLDDFYQSVRDEYRQKLADSLTKQQKHSTSTI
jgi:hypothetical protein